VRVSVSSNVRRWLLPWLLAFLPIASASGALRLAEFQADNEIGLVDEDLAHSDWIEIENPDGAAVSLGGYHLTDDPALPGKWTFPELTLEAGARLVVFASGKNRTDPLGRLHTNFQLASEGEYLALVAPDGVTVVQAFDPAYPAQFADESFGLGGAGPVPEWTFFPKPTPGAPNGAGNRAGPTVRVVEPNPPAPGAGPLTVTRCG
jgi:hypothetical protein